MKWMIVTVSLLFVSTTLSAQDRPTWAADVESSGVRDVQVSANNKKPITINTKIRITTMLVFPDDEKIVKKFCGDTDNWVIDPKDIDPQLTNMLSVKPTQVDQIPTNLTVLTTKRLYTFWLKTTPKGTPDVQVTLVSDTEATPSPRKWYAAAEFEVVQAQLIEAQVKLEALQAQLTESVTHKPVAEAEPEKHFDYGPIPYEKPFKVKSLWHAGGFTYIQTDASEMPTVYELKDNKPSVLDPHIENGLITIYKIVDEGRLVLGDKKQTFKLVKGN